MTTKKKTEKTEPKTVWVCSQDTDYKGDISHRFLLFDNYTAGEELILRDKRRKFEIMFSAAKIKLIERRGYNSYAYSVEVLSDALGGYIDIINAWWGHIIPYPIIPTETAKLMLNVLKDSADAEVKLAFLCHEKNKHIPGTMTDGRVRLNPTQLSALLKAVGADKPLCFYMIDSTTPIKLTADNGSFSYIAMPIATEEEWKKQREAETAQETK